MKCDKCRGGFGLTAIGSCKNCGSMISSSSDKLCDPCSTNLNECKTCRAPLTAADKDPFAN